MADTNRVIPAKAGTQLLRAGLGATGGRWVPAFAGMTIKGGAA